jgi:hypothetical protein
MRTQQMRDRSDINSSLRSTADSLVAICDDLLNAVARPVATLDRKSVPRVRGIYLWRCLKTEEPVYVGIAVGEWGLYQRIAQQHLLPGYWKKREGKEQSVFREKVAADAGVRPGAECVAFIEQHFTLGFLECPQYPKETIEAAEKLMIAAVKPKFNDCEGRCHTADVGDDEDEGDARACLDEEDVTAS